MAAERPDERTPGVLNLSLAGNRLNHEGTEPGAGGFPGLQQLGPNALARLNEDVFAQTNARTVITDLGHQRHLDVGRLAEAIIATLRQINQQVQARGLRSLVATLTPVRGARRHPGGLDAGEGGHPAGGERYLRGSQEFDGCIDFDRVLRDPARPGPAAAGVRLR